jgi:plasmid stabilization system protein ParE
MLVRWTRLAADDLTHISDYTQKHFGLPDDASQPGRPGRKPRRAKLALSPRAAKQVLTMRRSAARRVEAHYTGGYACRKHER